MKRFANVLLLAAGLWLGVNLTASAAETLNLAGTWRFAIDDHHAGRDAKWFTGALPGAQTIPLPGTMDDAGLGPVNTNAPTLEGPWRKYLYYGPAWYQRDLDIPANWQGQHVTLFLERCRWVTSAWLDDQPLGSRDSLIAPHQFDLGTALTPGHHRLTLCIDNTVKLDLGRFVSALFGGTWGNMNGAVGRLELTATPPVWLDDVQVYPDAQHHRARVAVKVGNATGQPGNGELHIGNQTLTAAWDASGGRVETEVDLAGVPLWDEFHPHLTELTVKLGEDRRTVRFGLRDFGTKGTQFTLNGRTVFLRGTLECSIFPQTGYPPCTPEWWRHIFAIEKSYGLNYIRFHSWCPPDAAFTAADEAGILIHVEAPQANVPAGSQANRDAFLAAELNRIVDTYGNHPSFCLMTLGNEYGGHLNVISNWVGGLETRDPRHCYSSASNNHQRPANRQFSVRTEGRGIHGPGTEYDLRATVAGDPYPVLGHEIGQWMFFPDFREEAKYTGVMELKNFEMIRDDLARHHLLDRAQQFVDASGPFAVRLYKEEVESLIRTPGYGGFALLDLHDYPTQGTALIGLLDEFWDSKGFITPAEFRRFCSPTVPLVRLPRRTYTNSETFTATAQIAHYGETDLSNAQPKWTLCDSHGNQIGSGDLPARTVPTGGITELGTIRVPLGNIQAPERVRLTLSLAGTDIANDWDLWVYPDRPVPAAPAGVTVCEHWADAQAALAAGRKVILFAAEADPHQSLAGRFTPVFWSPVWFPSQKPNTMGLLCDSKHPAFAQFPTDRASDWQWYDLMQHSRVFILDDTAPDFQPFGAVIDNFARNHKLGVLFEGRVGNGSLLVSGFDLPRLTDSPAARQLLASLYAYAGSDAFQPKQSLDADLLAKLFRPVLTAAGVTPPGLEKAVLYVKAGGKLATEGSTPWASPVDDIQVAKAGFGYDVKCTAVWKDEAGTAWFGSSGLSLNVRVPVPGQYDLYVHFHDWNDAGREGKVKFAGHEYELGEHNGTGKWVKLEVRPEDCRDGRIIVEANPTAGPNLQITAFALIPR